MVTTLGDTCPSGKPTPTETIRQIPPLFLEAVNLHQQGRISDARAIYTEILSLDPAHSDSLHLLGVTYIQAGEFQRGIDLLEQAIRINPNAAPMYINHGNALVEIGRHRDALNSFNKALRIEPHSADALYNRGNALSALKQAKDALADYERALAIRPDYRTAYINRGNVLTDLKRLDESVESYEKALAIQRDGDFCFSSYFHNRMRLCDWRNLSENLADYELGILQGKQISTPFPALSLLDKPALHLRVAQIYTQAKHPGRRKLSDFPKPHEGKKIRVAYYSADFHNHATTYLIAQLLESHDSRYFEFYGFSLGVNESQDEMRKRVASAFHKFVDVSQLGDHEIVRLSREFCIDIAVDLKGHTQDARPGIFAAGCAPLQVAYLGYPGTFGADYMDYLIADKTLIPKPSLAYYTEKIIYVPHSYQANDSTRKISEKTPGKVDQGLPGEGFVFCCFNNSYKILPSTFDGWMRILSAVDGSVLWLLQDNPTGAKNLRREAEARGVDGGRLVFAARLNQEDHLARHRLADLFLDTLPCNAHTTASDALWAGLPLLTCAGESFASRVSASLLKAIGLPELIAETQEEYEEMAIALANNPLKLSEIKQRLEENRGTAPLFDGKRLARSLEKAYQAIYARYKAGLSPEHLYIQEQAGIEG